MIGTLISIMKTKYILVLKYQKRRKWSDKSILTQVYGLE